MIGAVCDRVDRFIDRRFASRPSWVVVVELFLALGWARSSIEKMIRTQWWNGTDITTFITQHQHMAIGWYTPLLEIVEDTARLWAVVVVALEASIATAFLVSRRVALALATAVFLNVSFVLAGATNPSIFYLVMQLGLGMWILEEVVPMETGIRVARIGALVSIGLAVACLPYLTTLQPGEVIDDPAAVLASGSACGAVALVAARRRIRRRQLHRVIDVRTQAVRQDAVATY